MNRLTSDTINHNENYLISSVHNMTRVKNSFNINITIPPFRCVAFNTNSDCFTVNNVVCNNPSFCLANMRSVDIVINLKTSQSPNKPVYSLVGDNSWGIHSMFVGEKSMHTPFNLFDAHYSVKRGNRFFTYKLVNFSSFRPHHIRALESSAVSTTISELSQHGPIIIFQLISLIFGSNEMTIEHLLNRKDIISSIILNYKSNYMAEPSAAINDTIFSTPAFNCHVKDYKTASQLIKEDWNFPETLVIIPHDNGSFTIL